LKGASWSLHNGDHGGDDGLTLLPFNSTPLTIKMKNETKQQRDERIDRLRLACEFGTHYQIREVMYRNPSPYIKIANSEVKA